MRIFFTVPGEPKGKGRPRFTREGRTYTPPETAGYENLVKLCYREKYGGMAFEDAALSLGINAYFTIPKSVSKKKRDEMLKGYVLPTKRPDLDNILKIVADALNGVAYNDDAQIVGAEIHKYFAAEPHVDVYLDGGLLR